MNFAFFQRTILACLAGWLLAFPLRSQERVAVPTNPETRFQIPATDDGLPGLGRFAATIGFAISGRNAAARGQARRAGSGCGRVPGRFDHPRLGRRYRRLVSRREGRQSRHQRRHDARRAHSPAGRRARVAPAAVVLLIGTNDLEEKADPETIGRQPETDPGRS